jgi:hypothetical protein
MAASASWMSRPLAVRDENSLDVLQRKSPQFVEQINGGNW